MTKEEKKPQNKRNKRFIFFIICFLMIIIIPIPIFYIVEYNQNKVEPFAEDLTKLQKEGYEIKHLTHDEFKEFDFELIATKFDITKNYRVTYTYTANYKDTQISKVKMKVALCVNWIKFTKESSELDIKSSNSNNSTTTIYDIEAMLEKKNPLLPLPKPTTYVLLTYERGSTQNKNKYAYVIEYPYGSYEINQGGFPS